MSENDESPKPENARKGLEPKIWIAGLILLVALVILIFARGPVAT